ncbi:Exodeoxyribonuclease 7 small subunit [Chlamydiales bacterium STE3]|nr:Exodeoxyribonuclease 7 small subunit [Chlamydiales bacterium STE3]
MTEKEEQEAPFEQAFSRLEEILEKMHSGVLSLDESIKLYEEADKLIIQCNKRLSDAERKIEVLIKNRTGELTLGSDGKPLTQNFSPINGN